MVSQARARADRHPLPTPHGVRQPTTPEFVSSVQCKRSEEGLIHMRCQLRRCSQGDEEGDDPRQDCTIGTDEMRDSIIAWASMDNSTSRS
jgi:hypothetical protein